MNSCRPLLILFAAGTLLSASPAAAGEIRAAEFESYLSNLFEFYNQRSELALPSLSTKQIQELVAGKSVHLTERDPIPGSENETVDRVIGMRLIPHPRENVWIAALDPDVPIGDFFHDVRLDQDGKGYSRWWVYLDLPWPIADRHWVADLWKNLELAADADGYLWEHRWDLTEGGLEIATRMVAEKRLVGVEPADVAQAVYLPVNRGGLLAAPYQETHTLLIYNLSTVVGGFIPDRVVNAFSRQQVGSFLETVERRAGGILAHYGPDHERLFDGEGNVMPSRAVGSAHDYKAADNR